MLVFIVIFPFVLCFWFINSKIWKRENKEIKKKKIHGGPRERSDYQKVEV